MGVSVLTSCITASQPSRSVEMEARGGAILLATAYFTRYQHVAFITEGGAAKTVWYRWLHGTVFTVEGTDPRCF